jgi:ABC-2 type transport system permease protein
MSKYLAISKVLFKAQLVYRFDVTMTALALVWRVLSAWILWGAIFAGRETVGGFTFQAMLSYYVVASLLASLDMSEGVSGEVSARIRGGTFSKFMVIPSNPQLHFMAQNFGSVCYYALFAIIATVFSVFAFRVQLTFAAEPAAIACALVMIPLGLTFMVSYQYFIGLLTFKFQDIGFFTHIQGNLLAFLTGSIVPLSLLPDGVQGALRFLPFTYVTYTPAMLLTGRKDGRAGLLGLLILALWTVGMILISHLAYQRLRVQYDGVGI